MLRLNADTPALLRALKKSYLNAVCELDHSTALELLVATILSAQCTDKRVNQTTPALFARYRSPADYAFANLSELEGLIKSCGFYRTKAKNIRGMAQILVDRFGGQVPSVMDHLLLLPGVARKTANVVLGNAFNKAEGVVVDTHVMRLSARLGLSRQKTPEKIERDLMKKIPQKDWVWFSHALIWHGRRVCFARNPLCPSCPIQKQCPNPQI
jgi:endonuclease III